MKNSTLNSTSYKHAACTTDTRKTDAKGSIHDSIPFIIRLFYTFMYVPLVRERMNVCTHECH